MIRKGDIKMNTFDFIKSTFNPANPHAENEESDEKSEYGVSEADIRKMFDQPLSKEQEERIEKFSDEIADMYKEKFSEHLKD